MSSKGSKRRQRRINTHEEEPEKKIEEIIEQSDENKSNISADTDKVEKDTLVKEENGEQQSIKEPELATTIQNGKDTNNTVKESTETKTDTVETTNGQIENEITNSQSTENSERKSVGNDENSDLEPLVFDSEDTELQCQSETTSERSSDIEKSPILNRCQTRRSQTRNVPTPKTPKSLDFNGDAECKSEVRVNVTRLTVNTPEVIVTPPEEDLEEKSQDNVLESTVNTKPEETTEACEESDEDLANASVFVNYTGNDTTRNLDITTTSTVEDDGPSFLDTAKDMSYGETLRCISGRKGLRHHYANHPPRFYKSTSDLTSKDLTDAVKKYTPSSGQKRKLNANRDSSPDEYKRVKIDGDTNTGTSGIMSFIQSPFQTKQGRTEIPSSTPKLTSFKYTPHHQGSTVIDEVSKIDLDLHHERPNITTESKKWCSIM